MTNQAKVKKNVQKTLIYVLLVLLAAFFLFPVVFMLFKSVMSPQESIGTPYVKFFPSSWHFENFAKVFDSEIVRMFFNTIILIVCNVTGTILSACCCAYGFARGKFKSKGFWFAVMLSTIMLPAMVTQVPLYVLFSQLKMTGTLLPLIVPSFFGGGALNIFLTYQFVRGISKELDEAAVIDGANRFYIFIRIILPLLKPIIIYILINVVINCWREFDSALIYIGNTAKSKQWQPLALGIYFKFLISGSEDSYPCYQMATGVLMTAPMAILFFIFQGQLIDGIQMGAVKG